MKRIFIFCFILFGTFLLSGCDLLGDIQPELLTAFTGEATITYSVGEEIPDYADLVDLKIGDQSITIDESMIDSSDVDLTVEGTYEVLFSFTGDESDPITFTLTVIVIDERMPTVLMLGEAEMTIEVQSEYIEPGFSGAMIDGSVATVLVDGRVDDSAVGDYTLIYYVEEDEKVTSIERVVHVVDTTVPTIELDGYVTQYLYINSEYQDKGVIAEDNYDLELEILVVDLVDYALLGTYEITYQAQDSSGNLSEILTRTVIITDQVLPFIEMLGDDEITLEVFSVYEDAGVAVYDDYDTELEPVVINNVDINTVGTYTVTYDFTDSDTNSAATITRTVNVVDTVAPIINMNGETETVFAYHDTYFEEGATVTDNYDSNITITITENFDYINGGTISYYAEDSSGNYSEVIRNITIIDNIGPEMSFIGLENIIIPVGDSYIEQGVNSIDEFDGELIPVIDNQVDTSIVGEYSVIYTATDSSGNHTMLIRTVQVVDVTPPVIELIGDEEITLQAGSEYIDQGVLVTDNYDTDLVATVVNTVDTSILDTYIITYDVTDSNGNIAIQITRTVHVIDTTPPDYIQNFNSIHIIQLEDKFDSLITVTDNYELADIYITSLVIKDSSDNIIASIEELGIYTITYDLIDLEGNSTTAIISLDVNELIPEYELFKESFDFDYLVPTDMIETTEKPIKVLYTEQGNQIICQETIIEFYDGLDLIESQSLQLTHEIQDCMIINDTLYVINLDTSQGQDVNTYTYDLNGTRLSSNNIGYSQHVQVAKFDDLGNVLLSFVDAGDHITVIHNDITLSNIQMYSTSTTHPSAEILDVLFIGDDLYLTYLEINPNPISYIQRFDEWANPTDTYLLEEHSRYLELLEYENQLLAIRQTGVDLLSLDLELVDSYEFDCYTFYTDAFILEDYLYLATSTGGNTCSRFNIDESGGMFMVKIDLENLEYVSHFYVDNRIFEDMSLSFDGQFLYWGVTQQQPITPGQPGNNSMNGYFKFEIRNFMNIQDLRLEVLVDGTYDLESITILQNLYTPLDLLQVNHNIDFNTPGEYPIEVYYYLNDVFYRYDTFFYVTGGGSSPTFDCNGIDTIYIDSSVDFDNFPTLCTVTDIEDGDLTNSVTYQINEFSPSQFDENQQMNYEITYSVMDSDFNEIRITKQVILEEFTSENIVLYDPIDANKDVTAIGFYSDTAADQTYTAVIENIDGDGKLTVYDESLNIVWSKTFAGIELYDLVSFNNEIIISMSITTNEYFTNSGNPLSTPAAEQNNLLIINEMIHIFGDSNFNQINTHLEKFDIQDGYVVEKNGAFLNVYETSGDYLSFQVPINEFASHYTYFIYNDHVYVGGQLEDDGDHGDYQNVPYQNSKSVLSKLDLSGNLIWFKSFEGDGYISNISFINNKIMVNHVHAYGNATLDLVTIPYNYTFFFFDETGELLNSYENEGLVQGMYSNYNSNLLFGYNNENKLTIVTFGTDNATYEKYFSLMAVDTVVISYDANKTVIFVKTWDTYDGLLELDIDYDYFIMNLESFHMSISSNINLEHLYYMVNINGGSLTIEDFNTSILNTYILDSITYTNVSFSYNGNTFIVSINMSDMQ